MDRKIVGGLYETVLNRILGFDLPNTLPSARCHEVAHLTSLGISLSLLEMGELSSYDEPKDVDAPIIGPNLEVLSEGYGYENVKSYEEFLERPNESVVIGITRDENLGVCSMRVLEDYDVELDGKEIVRGAGDRVKMTLVEGSDGFDGFVVVDIIAQ